MELRQMIMHDQGFGTGSVKAMLDCVPNSLSAIAARNGVRAIVSKWEVHGLQSNCETIDVTSDVVNLFKPDKNVLKIIQDLADKKPIKDAFFIED